MSFSGVEQGVFADGRHLFEIKSAMTFNAEFLNGLKYLSEIMRKSKKKSKASLIYAGVVEQTFQDTELHNWFNFLQEVEE